jgi:hypothetical protein
MSEYSRPNDKIQAGFALHVVKLLTQYRKMTSNLLPTEKYDATLTVCALQALLTNCTELMESMKISTRLFWHEPITDIPRHWGIRTSFVVEDTCLDEQFTYDKFITHLRNALSHPTTADKPPHYPSTGYTTLPDGTGVITRFRFIDSPWVSRGKLYYPRVTPLKKEDVNNEKVKEKRIVSFLESFQEKHPRVHDLEVRKDANKYTIYQGDQIYIPVFIAELPLAALTDMAIELANHIAQPVQADWDGKTIRQLVA